MMNHARHVLVALVALATLGRTGVQASQILDLTTQGATQSGNAAIGGGFIEAQDSQLKSATGIFKPFVRIQAKDTEQGYNTSLGTPLDDKGGPWTHAIKLSDVAIETVNGVDYRVFNLGINQDQHHPNLSLNQVQIFQTNQDRLSSGLTAGAAGSAPVISFASSTEVFRVNNANDPNFYETQLNSGLSHGNGTGDMVLFVRNSDFKTAYGDNVILYSQFGSNPGAYASDPGGFEEWGVNGNNQDPTSENILTPEPSTLAGASTAVLMGLVFAWRRRRVPVAS